MKKKKTKIFFFNPYPAVGGVDTTIKKFINSLDLRYYNIEYLTLKKCNYKFNKNITFTNLKKNSVFLSYFKIISLLSKDKNEKKIFFSLQYFTNIWTVLFLKRIKQVKIFLYEVNHLDELNNYKNPKEFIKKNIIKFLIKALYSRADLIAGNSEELSNDLSKYIKKKVFTLYNPCFYRFKKKINENKLHREINILNIGRLDFQKDHYTLLKAISTLKSKNRIKLTFVGMGEYFDKIENFAYRNKINLKIFPNETNLEKFYLKADLYISTSLYEGLPTTMVEAASYNLPIISSNFRSGCKEILNNGKNGHIFRVKDHVHLATLIEKFISDKKNFIKKTKNFKYSLNKFSYKKNIEIFRKLLIKLTQ
jgi:glycosyltransferase involved in cell wall biosynthesis